MADRWCSSATARPRGAPVATPAAPTSRSTTRGDASPKACSRCSPASPASTTPSSSRARSSGPATRDAGRPRRPGPGRARTSSSGTTARPRASAPTSCASRPRWSIWTRHDPRRRVARTTVGHRVDKVLARVRRRGPPRGPVRPRPPPADPRGPVVRSGRRPGSAFALDPASVSILGHEREAHVIEHWNLVANRRPRTLHRHRLTWRLGLRPTRSIGLRLSRYHPRDERATAPRLHDSDRHRRPPSSSPATT